MAEGKRRHGCLTTWLVVIIIGNAITTLMYLLWSDPIRLTLPNAPGWIFPILTICSLFNLFCAIMLFQWKKWAFWVICASGVVALAINLSLGLGIGRSLIGLLGVALLYGVLNIGKENKGWTQLE